MFHPFRRKNEVVQLLDAGVENLVAAAFPLLVPLVDKNDFVANLHHGVHIVGVDDGGDIVFDGDFFDKIVDDNGRYGVETGIRLITI